MAAPISWYTAILFLFLFRAKTIIFKLLLTELSNRLGISWVNAQTFEQIFRRWNLFSSKAGNCLDLREFHCASFFLVYVFTIAWSGHFSRATTFWEEHGVQLTGMKFNLRWLRAIITSGILKIIEPIVEQSKPMILTVLW